MNNFLKEYENRDLTIKDLEQYRIDNELISIKQCMKESFGINTTYKQEIKIKINDIIIENFDASMRALGCLIEDSARKAKRKEQILSFKPSDEFGSATYPRKWLNLYLINHILKRKIK